MLLFLVVLFYQIQSKRALIWLCLERCGETESEVEAYVQIIKEKAKDCLTDISFEAYDLGDNSTLVNNHFIDVYSMLKGTVGHDGPLRMLPMITTVNIERMREVFKNPDPFIQACIKTAKLNAYDGFNIDWEPEHGVVESDRPLYNSFMKTFSEKMKAANLILNVAVATWSVLWDYKDLNNLKEMESIITMETYVSGFDLFKTEFQQIYADMDHDLIGIGLDSEWKTFTDVDVTERFEYISQYDIAKVDVWRMVSSKFGETSVWWSELEKWINK